MTTSQYVIDIAAEMPEGAATADQLDAIAAKLTGGGKAATYFSDAIAKVDGELAAARATQAKVAESVAAASAEYKALAKEAATAAKVATSMSKKGDDPFGLYAADAKRAKDALGPLEEKIKTLKAAERAAAGVVDKHAASLAGIKTLQGHVAKGYEQNAQKLEKLAGALNQVGGPLGRAAAGIVQKRKALSELEGVSGAAQARIIAFAGTASMVTVAVLAVTVAIVAGTVAIAAWAVGLADANREAELSAEAFDTMNPKVGALRGEIDALYMSTGQSVETLQGWAQKLTRAGLSGDRAARAMAALATAETALGKGGADKFAARMMAGGESVDHVADEIDRKLGGVAAKKLQGLGAQAERFKRSIADVFGGLNIEKPLAALGRLVGMFDTATGTGKATKFLFESVFQPLIDKADAAAYVIEAVFLGFQIAALKVYIGLKPVIKALGEVFGFDTQGKGFADTLDMIVWGVDKLARGAIILGIGLGVVVGLFTGVLALMVAIPVALAAAGVAFVDFGIDVVKAIVGGIGEAIEWFKAVPWADLGMSIVDGIVDGLKRKAHAAVDAFKSLADQIMGGGEEELEIHSPSKRSARMADDVADGVVIQTEKNESRVRAAAADTYGALVPADSGNAPANTPAPARAAVSLDGATLNFYGVKDAEHGADMFEDALTRILEGDATSLGAPSP